MFAVGCSASTILVSDMADFNLNESQSEAVYHGSGPLLVIAGPGSGKTRVISCRIADLIQNRDVSPSDILAITFTNKAAAEMRSRISEMLSDNITASSKIWISTFHSMCVKILRRHATKLGYSSDFHIYDESDAETALVNVCTSMGAARKDARREAKNGLAECASLAKNDLADLEFLCEGKEMPGIEGETISYFDILTAFDEHMRSQDAMTFDDLLFCCWKLFCDFPDVLEAYQKRFVYVFVDEYQDTNRVQNELVKLLADPQNNICAVGDPDQSIYRFRGARVENIVEMEHAFENTKVVYMGENYRSVSEIVQTGADLISYNPDFFGRGLNSQRGSAAEHAPVNFVMLEDSTLEAEFVASETEQRLAEGTPASEIAVFYRMHAMSESLEIAFKRRGIPYKISGGTSFFDRTEIKDCMAMLRAASVNPDIVAANRAAAKLTEGLGAKSLEKIAEYAVSEKISMLDAFLSAGEAGLTGQRKKSAISFGEKLASATKIMLNSGPAEALRFFMPEYEKSWKDETSEQTESRKARLREFSEMIAGCGDYREASDMLALEGSEFASDGSPSESGSEHVCLMTYHASKGLEFGAVFLIGMEEEIMTPSWFGRSPEDIQEARRLAYVGATRAKDKLYVTASHERHLGYLGSQRQRISRFWNEMGGEPPSAEKAVFEDTDIEEFTEFLAAV